MQPSSSDLFCAPLLTESSLQITSLILNICCCDLSNIYKFDAIFCNTEFWEQSFPISNWSATLSKSFFNSRLKAVTSSAFWEASLHRILSIISTRLDVNFLFPKPCCYGLSLRLSIVDCLLSFLKAWKRPKVGLLVDSEASSLSPYLKTGKKCSLLITETCDF